MQIELAHAGLIVEVFRILHHKSIGEGILADNLSGRDDIDNGIAVAVDSSPVGIDIEGFRSPSMALVNKTMNPAEAKWIKAYSDPVESFTQYWTKKEAVVKMRGTGITDDLHRVLDGEGYRLKSFVNREKRYAWSVAYSL